MYKIHIGFFHTFMDDYGFSTLNSHCDVPKFPKPSVPSITPTKLVLMSEQKNSTSASPFSSVTMSGFHSKTFRASGIGLCPRKKKRRFIATSSSTKAFIPV